MTTDFGIPPGSSGLRELVEQRLAEASGASGVPETLKVEFRGALTNVQVIDMPVGKLFYNPGTHRIRAQRSHDLAKDEALSSDPWSDESQDYLHYLLTTLPADPSRRDPKFEELQESLRDHSQLEPGLITRDGILVNGNTRRAALKEIAAPTIRVGVLPASCTWDDIHAAELALQLRPDHRRDYSYINHLLAVEEQLALGRQPADIARMFRTTSPVVDRDLWVLNNLRDLVRRSESGGFSLRMMDFEDAKEKLAELYRTVQNERSKEKADLLKEARLAAIVLDFAKTDVRNIGADFQARFLDQRLPEEFKTKAPAPAVKVIPGLNRAAPATVPQVDTARALTDTVLKLKAIEIAGEKAEPKRLAEAAKAKEDLKKTFDEAIEFAGKDFRMRKKRQAAPDRVADACKDLDQCVTDLAIARGNGSLDQETFDEKLVELREALTKLAVAAGKTIDLPGDGLTWLTAAVATE
ncbi:ParB/RepB/Spo0J family partition protein [Actinoplanes rectilineatus]|uniref:ParB/RepB/Spo0J family partition protein n=1 Tax=Actinoplanes rectilineatus TaxID=113571 RepID=UPI0005F2A0B6|nr:ParB/RepB/Spo0J family partition protein [Actinoplanes rectilineatus]